MVRGWIGAPLGAALLAGGCAPSPAAPGAPRPGTLRPGGTPAAAAAAVPDAGADGPALQVLGQYRRFHQVFEYTLETGDPGRVPEVATGTAAARLLAAVRANRRAGVVQRGHAVPHPRLLARRAATADVLDCATASGLWTFRIRSGAQVGRAPEPGRYLLYARLVRSGGVWRVDSVTYPRDHRC
ncbi:hypothetical protein [Actinomadura macrotermitis]|uniref:Lipoprotein n=1 Tax=Actinomadura macrotermitis TaxID=2585200 RepID=A0A7K0BRD3_9ACTN|nr:hypothetical protein [Actinomadura macrotermitis]MQY03711.1 hypothetical protein [Actinomadura macrotermitis]